MKTRSIIAAGLISLGMAGLQCAASAQGSYPERPVRIVVGFPAGASTDVAARAVAQKMSDIAGQQFVVENRPGASSNIATEQVARAPADGYTLLVGTIANTINPSFQASLPFDFTKDFAPVGMIGSVPNFLVVHPSMKASSMAELIAEAKSRPGQITYASSGNGTAPHLSGELFASMAGIKLVHVPYRGSSPAVTDLLAGQVQAMFSPASTVLPHIRSGKLRALATTGASRSAAAPDLATVSELGLAGFETSVWFGLVAPANTPADVVRRLSELLGAALDDPQIRQQFAAQAIDTVKAGPGDFSRYIASETRKWAQVVKDAGIKPQ
ncbi:tripartite tricarboxylate transporter substrate binding protein [Burkholderiaceae bacterium FT117]|uniref:tripartite tricarboxylate transporter substrate binding protein n=1 Tax=Zeimonas sediminis TaxID=2944268 RepID=UPI002342F149|nr:tripartite tricarboxylate transporter substrate binding protein [Zeimonas sediminis]MCM5571769.1 tripartite tricarboxylate transporter substrate binding protein [Zeimonas sediminis]